MTDLPTREEAVSALWRKHFDSNHPRVTNDIIGAIVDALISRGWLKVKEPEREDGWYLLSKLDGDEALFWSEGHWWSATRGPHYITSSLVHPAEPYTVQRLQVVP